MSPRLSLNQATVKYASFAEVVDLAVRHRVPAIGAWRESVQDHGVSAAAQLARDAGLRVSSLCRGGFFTDPDTAGRHDDNRRAIEEAAVLGAPALVLVAGGLPEGSKDLVGARRRVADAIAALVPDAEAAGVQLAIEPLHPMYAADRAVINTLAQALELASAFPAPVVGVVVDTFHLWWDPSAAEIVAGTDSRRIASFQVCDWLNPMAADPLLSRAIMGDGVIDFGPLTRAVLATGYLGDIEVEVFNQEVWDTAPGEVVGRVGRRFADLIEPLLE